MRTVRSLDLGSVINDHESFVRCGNLVVSLCGLLVQPLDSTEKCPRLVVVVGGDTLDNRLIIDPGHPVDPRLPEYDVATEAVAHVATTTADVHDGRPAPLELLEL